MKHLILLALSCCSFSIFLTTAAQSSAYSGKIIDLHIHIALRDEEKGSLSNERNNSLKEVLDYLHEKQIEKAGIIVMAQKGRMADTRWHNDSVIALSRQYAAILPICSVHPLDGDSALAEMERVHQLGARIIKLHPNFQKFDVAAPEVARVASKAEELGMILLFDSYNPLDANEPGKLLMLAVAHPGARFIFAHMGLVSFPHFLTIEVFKKYPWYKNNIWFDLSGIAPLLGDSPFREQLVWTIRKIGVKQFLFGSDFPVFDPSSAIQSIHAMGFTKEEEKMIFYTNARQLLRP